MVPFVEPCHTGIIKGRKSINKSITCPNTYTIIALQTYWRPKRLLRIHQVQHTKQRVSFLFIDIKTFIISTRTKIKQKLSHYLSLAYKLIILLNIFSSHFSLVVVPIRCGPGGSPFYYIWLSHRSAYGRRNVSVRLFSSSPFSLYASSSSCFLWPASNTIVISCFCFTQKSQWEDEQ